MSIQYGRFDRLTEARYGRGGPTTDLDPQPDRDLPNVAPAAAPDGARAVLPCRNCGERPHLPHLPFCAECL